MKAPRALLKLHLIGECDRHSILCCFPISQTVSTLLVLLHYLASDFDPCCAVLQCMKRFFLTPQLLPQLRHNDNFDPHCADFFLSKNYKSRLLNCHNSTLSPTLMHVALVVNVWKLCKHLRHCYKSHLNGDLDPQSLFFYI